MATAEPADQKLVVDVSAMCKLLPCGDGRHFTWKVMYDAAKQLPAGAKISATCTIDGVYKFEVIFRPPMTKQRAVFMALVSGPRHHGVRKVVVDLVLLDNTRSVAAQRAVKSVTRPVATGSNQGGCGLIVRKDFLETNCLKDGVVVALCSVLILPELPRPLWSDSLGNRLAAMSTKQELTDVCFDVDGEKFHAHRLVMAAQSEEFRAMLFDSKAKIGKMETIVIDNVSASTFKHMLHYMYCNQLPIDDNDDDHTSRIVELHHLLVAADIYGVETLKQLCEDTLCAGITSDTVSSTLALTDKRSYPKLRASCIEFLSETPIYSVAKTDVYNQLLQSYPGVLTELRDFKRARLSPNLTPSTDTKDDNQGALTEIGESSKRPRLSPKRTPSTDMKDENN